MSEKLTWKMEERVREQVDTRGWHNGGAQGSMPGIEERANAREFRHSRSGDAHPEKASLTQLTPGKGKFSLVDTSALRACARMRASPSTKTPRARARANVRALL